MFPVASLLNHKSKPNCTHLPAWHALQLVRTRVGGAAHMGLTSDCRGGRSKSNAMAVLTARAIKKGEELTVRYLDDHEAVRREWGIS